MLLQQCRMGRTAIAVDVESIRRDGHGDDFGAEFPQHRRRHLVGRTIGAIDDDFQIGEIETACRRRLDRLDVAALGIVHALGAADRGRRGKMHARRCNHELFDLVLDRVRELEAVGTEQLDAVVLEGIVRGRNHDADVGPHGTRQEADGRCRNRTEQEHVDTDRQESGGQRLLDHVAGEPCVLADHRAMTMAAAIEHLARGHADAHGDLGCHGRAVRAAAHTIGAEERTGHRRQFTSLPPKPRGPDGSP